MAIVLLINFLLAHYIIGMGKSSRPYPIGHYRLYKTNKSKADTPLSVQIEYSVKSIAVRRAIGLTVKNKDWNPNENNGRGGVRASYGQDYRNVNNRLSRRLDEMDANIAEWCSKNPNQINVEIIRAFLDGHPTTRDDKGIDFSDFVKANLKSEFERNKIGISVYKNGLSSMNIFGFFLKAENLGTYAPDKIYVSEISTDLIDRYIKWRREYKKNSDDTINHALTPLLKGCQLAMIQGYISTSLNTAIQQMRIIKQKSLQEDKQGRVKHMSKEQISKLIEFYHQDKETRRKEYIEMFQFSMYACGLRVVDVLTLQWSDIDLSKRTLNKIQVKTRNRNVIPLGDQAIKILEMWKGRHNRFVFGLLPDDFNLDDSTTLYKYRNTVTKCINQSLSTVSNKITIDFDLTFHVARHTFAVQSLNNGIQMTMVSQLLGHSSTEITEKVYAHFIPATIMDELRKVVLPSL